MLQPLQGYFKYDKKSGSTFLKNILEMKKIPNDNYIIFTNIKFVISRQSLKFKE